MNKTIYSLTVKKYRTVRSEAGRVKVFTYRSLNPYSPKVEISRSDNEISCIHFNFMIIIVRSLRIAGWPWHQSPIPNLAILIKSRFRTFCLSLVWEVFREGQYASAALFESLFAFDVPDAGRSREGLRAGGGRTRQGRGNQVVPLLKARERPEIIKSPSFLRTANQAKGRSQVVISRKHFNSVTYRDTRFLTTGEYLENHPNAH